MAKFMLAYHGGGMPGGEEAQAAAMAAWGAYMTKYADTFVGESNPVGMSKTVTPEGVADNGGSNPISGFAFVEAADINAACAIAAECPVLTDGGTVEVAPVVEM